ncbi:MAG: iron-containing alcohol dehydrogenase [Methanophagales archaeon]|nr:iron-containing alcohol dehydrogenase [Methanophagales archaeon]MCW3141819.1 iron-containing alcohol dehydrogenase [Methanophagales archaeon]
MVMYAVQLPKRVVFGVGIGEKIDAEAKGLGAKKALVVTDATMQKTGLLEKIEKPLREVVEVDILDKIEPEPTLAAAETVVAAARAAKYDLIVGIGGGSVLDMAKVASAAAANPEQGVSDFLGANKIANPSVPKILVPTTAGTGAEATPFALVIVEEKKKAIASPYNLANVVLIDPAFTATMPPKVTASTGIDALSHAIEAFLSTGSNPLTDSFALEAIRKIANNLEEAFSHGDNLDARLKMALAAMLAGMAFGNAGVIAGHAAAHTFGAKYKIPHGVSAALALPYMMEYNAVESDAKEKLAKVAREMGEDISGMTEEEAASKAVACVMNMLEKLDLPTRLADLDVPKEDLSDLAEAMSKEKGYLARNPRKIEYEDAVKMFERMWSGE